MLRVVSMSNHLKFGACNLLFPVSTNQEQGKNKLYKDDAGFFPVP